MGHTFVFRLHALRTTATSRSALPSFAHVIVVIGACLFSRLRLRAVVVVILINLPEAHRPERADAPLGFKKRRHELRRLLGEVLLRHVPHLAHHVEGRAHVLAPLVHGRVPEVLVRAAPHHAHFLSAAARFGKRSRHTLYGILQRRRRRGGFERVARGGGVGRTRPVGLLVLLHALRRDGELVAEVVELVHVRAGALAHAEGATVHAQGVGEFVAVP
mmetsp:Transcript_12091/g.50622  ORF Transcript_12091/g.50622 Transcript_12091/m.50622 type:complete len:217 (-) Transcript_12091:118-768(-)